MYIQFRKSVRWLAMLNLQEPWFNHLTASAQPRPIVCSSVLFTFGWCSQRTIFNVMVDRLQSRVTPWRQYASHVKVRGTSSKMDVRCKNGCAVSSIGKVGLLFGFNDSTKPLLY